MTTTNNFPSSTGYLPDGRGVRLIGRGLARLIGWNDARVTRNELSKLSDQELDDVGMKRGDIDAMPRGRH